MPESPVATLTEHFSTLEDSRADTGKRHLLLHILTIPICTAICAADSWVQIECDCPTMEEKGLYVGGRSTTRILPLLSFVSEHPRGLLVFDTGLNAAFATRRTQYVGWLSDRLIPFRSSRGMKLSVVDTDDCSSSSATKSYCWPDLLYMCDKATPSQRHNPMPTPRMPHGAAL